MLSDNGWWSYEVAGYTISCIYSSEYIKSQISCIDLMNMPFPIVSRFMMFLLFNKCQIFDFMKIVIIQVSSLLQELQHPLFYQGVFQADQEDSSR